MLIKNKRGRIVNIEICPDCGNALTKEMIDVNMCFECGFIIDKSLFDGSEDREEPISVEQISQEILDNQEKEETLKAKQRLQIFSEHLLTSGFNFEGFTIKRYNGIVSGSSIMGTGFISEFKAGFSDLFGVESETFSKKLEVAKKLATEKLIINSFSLGGNAVIGVDFDFITLVNNMLGVSANGTSVVIEKNVSL